MAKKRYSKVCKGRAGRSVRVLALAAEMKKNGFQGGGSVRFSPRGELLDGRHRLTAIKKL